MNAKFEINTEFNGIEITFDGKPDEGTRDALKSAGFRWHKVKKIWYAKNTDSRRSLAEKLTSGEQVKAEKTAKKAGKSTSINFDREALRAEYAKAWSSKSMIDYCTKKVLNIAELADGIIITIDKQPIETQFCFGESGYDYNEAVASAAHARTSTDYLKKENMKRFESQIAELDKVKAENHYYLVAYKKEYIGQSDDCKLGYVRIKHASDILEDVNNGESLADVYGKFIKSRDGAEYRILTPEEVEVVRSAYEAARSAHEKKVDAYIKRYGTSKVHAWTYWRDA